MPSVLRSLAVACLVSMNTFASEPYPAPSQLPAQPALPDPLVSSGGKPIATSAEWSHQRKPELRAAFQHYMYGQLPPAPKTEKFKVEKQDPNCLGGKATSKQVSIQLDPAGKHHIQLLLVIPNRVSKPVPTFVGLSFCGIQTVLPDTSITLSASWMPESCEGCVNHRATEASRGTQTSTWAIEQTVDRGYAAAIFYNGDVEPDQPGNPEGIRAYYAEQAARGAGPAYDWGAVAAWAWGFHRAVDYLVTDRDIDAKRIAAVGHSRNGKAALVAAAFDDRIALVIPHQAGCGGSAPSRGKVGEAIQQINDHFPHWFNAAFKEFNQAPDRLPFDQHELIALCAPRAVLLSNAAEDTWANPAGQFEMLQAAEPVYRLYGVDGLGTSKMPESGRLVGRNLAFYIRPGKHSMTTGDWKIFLDFADQHLR